MKRLMVLGGNPFQAPLARIAREMDCEVLLIDRNPDCEGRRYATRFEPISLDDKEGALKVAREFLPDGICLAGTDFTTTVGYLGDVLQLPLDRYVPYQRALLMSHKGMMRMRLSEEGVKQPDFYWHHTDDPIPAEPGPAEGPWIVKPCLSMGARGVRICRSWPEVVEHGNRLLAGGDVIVERYLGPEGPKYLSTDSMWLDGRLVFLATADRQMVNFPLRNESLPPGSAEGVHPVELGHDVPADLTLDEYLKVKETMIQVAEAFQYRTGFIKGDLMMVEGECYVGEVAARVSGSFNSGFTVPMAYGFQLHEAVVKVALGERDMAGLHKGEGPMYAVERTLVAHKAGKVKEIRLGNKARYADLLHLWVKEGDTVEPPTSNMQKVANVVCVRDTRLGARMAAEEALREVEVEVEG